MEPTDAARIRVFATVVAPSRWLIRLYRIRVRAFVIDCTMPRADTRGEECRNLDVDNPSSEAQTVQEPRYTAHIVDTTHITTPHADRLWDGTPGPHQPVGLKYPFTVPDKDWQSLAQLRHTVNKEMHEVHMTLMQKAAGLGAARRKPEHAGSANTANKVLLEALNDKMLELYSQLTEGTTFVQEQTLIGTSGLERMGCDPRKPEQTYKFGLRSETLDLPCRAPYADAALGTAVLRNFRDVVEFAHPVWAQGMSRTDTPPPNGTVLVNGTRVADARLCCYRTYLFADLLRFVPVHRMHKVPWRIWGFLRDELGTDGLPMSVHTPNGSIGYLEKNNPRALSPSSRMAQHDLMLDTLIGLHQRHPCIVIHSARYFSVRVGMQAAIALLSHTLDVDLTDSQTGCGTPLHSFDDGPANTLLPPRPLGTCGCFPCSFDATLRDALAREDARELRYLCNVLVLRFVMGVRLHADALIPSVPAGAEAAAPAQQGARIAEFAELFQDLGHLPEMLETAMHLEFETYHNFEANPECLERFVPSSEESELRAWAATPATEWRRWLLNYKPSLPASSAAATDLSPLCLCIRVMLFPDAAEKVAMSVFHLARLEYRETHLPCGLFANQRLHTTILYAGASGSRCCLAPNCRARARIAGHAASRARLRDALAGSVVVPSAMTTDGRLNMPVSCDDVKTALFAAVVMRPERVQKLQHDARLAVERVYAHQHRKDSEWRTDAVPLGKPAEPVVIDDTRALQPWQQPAPPSAQARPNGAKAGKATSASTKWSVAWAFPGKTCPYAMLLDLSAQQTELKCVLEGEVESVTKMPQLLPDFHVGGTLIKGPKGTHLSLQDIVVSNSFPSFVLPYTDGTCVQFLAPLRTALGDLLNERTGAEGWRNVLGARSAKARALFGSHDDWKVRHGVLLACTLAYVNDLAEAYVRDEWPVPKVLETWNMTHVVPRWAVLGTLTNDAAALDAPRLNEVIGSGVMANRKSTERVRFGGYNKSALRSDGLAMRLLAIIQAWDNMRCFGDFLEAETRPTDWWHNRDLMGGSAAVSVEAADVAERTAILCSVTSVATCEALTGWMAARIAMVEMHEELERNTAEADRDAAFKEMLASPEAFAGWAMQHGSQVPVTIPQVPKLKAEDHQDVSLAGKRKQWERWDKAVKAPWTRTLEVPLSSLVAGFTYADVVLQHVHHLVRLQDSLNRNVACHLWLALEARSKNCDAKLRNCPLTLEEMGSRIYNGMGNATSDTYRTNTNPLVTDRAHDPRRVARNAGELLAVLRCTVNQILVLLDKVVEGMIECEETHMWTKRHRAPWMASKEEHNSGKRSNETLHCLPMPDWCDDRASTGWEKACRRMREAGILGGWSLLCDLPDMIKAAVDATRQTAQEYKRVITQTIQADELRAKTKVRELRAQQDAAKRERKRAAAERDAQERRDAATAAAVAKLIAGVAAAAVSNAVTAVLRPRRLAKSVRIAVRVAAGVHRLVRRARERIAAQQEQARADAAAAALAREKRDALVALNKKRFEEKRVQYERTLRLRDQNQARMEVEERRAERAARAARYLEEAAERAAAAARRVAAPAAAAAPAQPKTRITIVRNAPHGAPAPARPAATVRREQERRDAQAREDAITDALLAQQGAQQKAQSRAREVSRGPAPAAPTAPTAAVTPAARPGRSLAELSAELGRRRPGLGLGPGPGPASRPPPIQTSSRWADEVEGEDTALPSLNRLPPRHKAPPPPAPATPDTVTSDTDRTCVVCMVEPRNCLFLPCAHAAACVTCANAAVAQGNGCPVCRAAVAKVQPFVWS